MELDKAAMQARVRAMLVDGGYNCAQTCCTVLQELTGVGDANLARNFGSGFGSGMGRCQSTCGAVVGGVMFVGLYLGLKESEVRNLNRASREPTRQLVQAFDEEFGCTDCRNLTGYDFSTREGLKEFQDSGRISTHCSAYVDFAVETVLEGLKLLA